MKTYGVPRTVDGQDTARAKDWLTALSPLLLMMVVNYRWSAVWAVVTATAGYLAVTIGWDRLTLMPRHLSPALLCGVLVACCLPAAAPLWLAPTAGILAAAVTALPVLVNRLFKRDVLSCPVYLPALIGYLLTRWWFPARFSAFPLPLMWERMDAVASATPLTSLGHPDTAPALSHLFWGFESGSMGDGPAVAVLLGFAFLLWRRRVRPFSPLMMLTVVFLLSWPIWGMPTYALLGGGTLLAALLLADEGAYHVGWKGRLATGFAAGVMTVLCRVWWQSDGAAIGVLTAGALTLILGGTYHGLRRLMAYLRENFEKSKN